MVGGKGRKREAAGRGDENEQSPSARTTCSAKRQRNIPFVVSGDEEEVATTGTGLEPRVEMLVAPGKFHGYFSSKHIYDLVSQFDDRKKAFMQRIGIGGLLWLRVGMMYNRRLSFGCLLG